MPVSDGAPCGLSSKSFPSAKQTSDPTSKEASRRDYHDIKREIEDSATRARVINHEPPREEVRASQTSDSTTDSDSGTSDDSDTRADQSSESFGEKKNSPRSRH